MIKHLFKLNLSKFKYIALPKVMENNSKGMNTINLDVNKEVSMDLKENLVSSKELLTYNFNKENKLVEQIQLNEREAKIFSIIKDVLKKNNKKTVCRVAGGWVRDKLLGRKNDDIDVALDDMMGKELAKMINDELYPGEDHYGVIESDKEQSKHLETATMRICDMFVDFVNLRSETYTEDSRVPQIEFGTPEQDAKRRDITINSMFYNINNDTVEDFLGTGRNDLANGYIKTPIDPLLTFADDPLRILRTIRFAVRFQFKLDPEICKAASDPEIKSALYKKISNERIAKELSLMLEGNKPQCALYLIHQLNLMDSVMKLPLGVEELKPTMDKEIIRSINLILLGGCILEKYVMNKNTSNEHLFFNKYIFNSDLSEHKETKKLFFLSLMTLPFKNYSLKSGKVTEKGTVLILKDSLKFPNEYIKEASLLHENIDQLVEYINLYSDNFDRLSSGRIIRKVKNAFIHKLVLLSICHEYVNFVHKDQNSLFEAVNLDELNRIINKYQAWYDFLEKQNLLNVDTLEPMIKGDGLVNLLGVKGKDIGTMLEYLIESQIINPNLTMDEVVEMLKKKREELGLNESNNSSNKKKKK